MIIKLNEKHRSIVMDYCLLEPNINLFIIGDIENFGFNTEFQEVWMQTIQDKLVGIILRYHDNFIIYSKDLDLKVEEIIDLLENKNAKIISGKLSVINLVYPFLKDSFSKRDMYFCELTDTPKLLEDTSEVLIANEEDAMEIAKTYEKINEFNGMYSGDIENRYNQILSRIKTKEGIHMFIKKDGEIISHGNTTAETSVSGMVGGILTLHDHRNKGLASKIVSSLCKNLSSRGKSACLFFDNPEAGKIYHRLGFKDIDKWVMLGRK